MALQSTAEPLDVARRSTRTMSSATKTEPFGEGVPFGDVRVPFRDRRRSPLRGGIRSFIRARGFFARVPSLGF